MTVLLPEEGVSALVHWDLLWRGAHQLSRIGSASLFDLAVVLGAPEAQVTPIWERLVAEGRIVQDKKGNWRPTDLMKELGKPYCGGRLPREAAVELLARVIDNARRVNSLPASESGFYVTRLVVSGGYEDREKDVINGLDIGWEGCHRPAGPGEQDASSPLSSQVLERTAAQLRTRSPFVRILDLQWLRGHERPFAEIYRFDPGVAAAEPEPVFANGAMKGAPAWAIVQLNGHRLGGQEPPFDVRQGLRFVLPTI